VEMPPKEGVDKDSREDELENLPLKRK